MKVKFINLKDLQAKKLAEIDSYIAELKKAHTDLTHSIHTGKEKTTHQLGLIKKSIARAHTVRSMQAKKEEK